MKYYAKLNYDPTFWLVEDGERRIVNSPQEMYSFGLFPVRVISAEELAEIPLVGQKTPPKAKVKVKDEKVED